MVTINIAHNWLLIKSYKNHFLISVIISLVLDIATRRFQVRIQGKQNQNWLLRLNQASNQKMVLTIIAQQPLRHLMVKLFYLPWIRTRDLPVATSIIMPIQFISKIVFSNFLSVTNWASNGQVSGLSMTKSSHPNI